MDETNKVLDLLSRINLFPGQKRLYDIAQKTNPEITKQQVAHYSNTDTTIQLTNVQ